ncbi:6-phosphofructo-2-kinase/fructose-2,6-bisphosphatase-like isoform X1 [Ischnura elegans]|uniref:6-phosphofructo-2-kinase/fructose-2, 6-bisphosphatase-like isoform X1 n=1 Tax=Ischnura elegans TaxID=197161 RepID=UPI001ED87943|nr:6-phosphofructo-2-kinase/fructose-2,6-bisphosphatase-like isoform X1 [Ischnura elegans]
MAGDVGDGRKGSSCRSEQHVGTIQQPLKESGSTTKQFVPLLVALVGLPARNKTAIAHSLARYLSWIGHSARVFSVSEYRRKWMEQYDNHDFFCPENEEAMELRKKCALEAMRDAANWVTSQHGEVAIIDGTNSTRSRRQSINQMFHDQMGWKVLFVESTVDDETILARNMEETRLNSPDYKEMSREKAINDFQMRIKHYYNLFETINNKNEGDLSYIKITNAGESILAHKLKGHLQSRILSFLSSYQPTPKTMYFSRHGESEFNVLGRIGGDADLSPRGRQYAASLARHINASPPPGLHIWTSEKRRTHQTVAGITASVEHWAALNELNAGVCEGMSYEEMQEQYPREFAWRDEDKLHYRYPWGESYADIMARVEPLLLELEQSGDGVLVVSHQAVLRVVLGYFLNKSPEEVPYLDVPLHTIVKLSSKGYDYQVEFTKLPVECVDTYRKKPKNCSPGRTADDALLTVPAHYDTHDYWQIEVSNEEMIK